MKTATSSLDICKGINVPKNYMHREEGCVQTTYTHVSKCKNDKRKKTVCTADTGAIT
jgi:hypothetical protein